MNNNGSVTIYQMMLGLTLIILGLGLAPSVSQFTASAMNSSSGDATGLDCNNASISDYDKGACVATDLTLVYFIGGVIFIGGAIFASKLLFQ